MNIYTEEEIMRLYGVPAEGFDVLTRLRAKEQYEWFIAGLKANGVIGVNLASALGLTRCRDEQGNTVYEVNGRG